MIDNEQLKQLVKEQEAYMIKTRRFLHENPEVSSHEFETSKFLQAEIKALNLEVVPVKGTGFYAILDTKKKGKTIGIRTDIDALPMQEHVNNLKGKRQVISKKDGVMHSCGHDGHMATVLGAARLLSSIKEHLTGKFVFIFEEGEEIGSGIAAMVEALKPLKLDAVYGTHLIAFMDTGDLCVDAGARMAGSVFFEFDVFGRGGHGSRPDLAINPIFATSNILNALTSAWANQVDVSKTVTLGVSTIHSGTALNIIPDSAYVGGSIRYFDEQEGERAFEIFKKVATQTAEAHNCELIFRDSTRITTIPVINDESLSQIVREGAKELYPDKLVSDVLWYASESFSYYSKLAPSVFSFVGIRNEDKGSGADHHNEYFDLDEEALSYSLLYTIKFVLDYTK